MPQNIERGQLGDMLDAGMPVIDVLPPKEHEELRIAGSIGIWLKKLDSDSVTRFSKSDPIVVYCHNYP